MTVHGKKFPVPGKGCPSTTPTPDADEHAADRVPDVPWPADSDADDLRIRDADVNRYWHGHADQHGDRLPRWRARRRHTAQAATGVKAGMAVGGVLAALLPGSLLWTTGSRRRRKRGAGGSR